MAPLPGSMAAWIQPKTELPAEGADVLRCGGIDNIVQDYKSLFWKLHSILLCMRRLLSAAEQLSKARYSTLAWIMAAWAQPRRQTCPSRALPTDNFVAPALLRFDLNIQVAVSCRAAVQGRLRHTRLDQRRPGHSQEDRPHCEGRR